MGLVTTMGKLRIIKCDGFGCNKKIESWDEKMVRNLALLIGWKTTDNRWFCSECAKKEEIQKMLPKSKKRPREPESTL